MFDSELHQCQSFKIPIFVKEKFHFIIIDQGIIYINYDNLQRHFLSFLENFQMMVVIVYFSTQRLIAYLKQEI